MANIATFTDLNTDLAPVRETDADVVRAAITTVQKWAIDADDERNLLEALGFIDYPTNRIGAKHNHK